MSSGNFVLLLHAHLPFVRHPEREHFFEETWLFEAITETYVPLLRTMQRLTNDHVPFRLTMSITPTLCAMLDDELLRQRYLEHLDLLIDLSARERKRNRTNPQLRELSKFYFDFFSETRRFFVDQWKCDLLQVFRSLRDADVLEIIASAATHAVLPLFSQNAARAQVLIGRDQFVESFHAEPAGFWSPECAYSPGLESIFQEANVRWFVVDAHGLLFGNPRPRRAIFAPCYTLAGPAAFARDRESSRQVWSAEEGYPGDPAYREFYRDIGFDLPLEHLGPVARGTRKSLGIKYYRITGKDPEKQLYDRSAANEAAERHASHFLEERRSQLRQAATLYEDPVVVVPFDAELFGHWWFEGPRFLESFIRKAAPYSPELSLITPSDYLRAHPTEQTIEPAASTWGENGHLAVWLDSSNAWIYPHLQGAAQRMTDVARRYSAIAGQTPRLPSERSKGGAPALQFTDRVLKQLARELLLAQASDWAFLMKTNTAREYATKRTQDHLARFNRLHDGLISNHVDEKFLAECETRDNLFRNVNWRYYV